MASSRSWIVLALAAVLGLIYVGHGLHGGAGLWLVNPAYAGYQYQIHLVAMWGTVAIASCVAAIISVIADFTSGIRRDWLHYGGIVAWLLGAVTIGLVWRRTIARFWLDVYLHVLG